MTLGYDSPLYILAFDHRGSFEKMLGVSGHPSREEHEKVSGAKDMIFEGFRRALEAGVNREAAGILVDAQYGERVARAAREEGLLLAMPVEKSGQKEFDFEYGEAFGEKIEEYDPSFSKVLVRYNPEGDWEMNRRQREKLKRLSDWLHERDRKFLFELLVPAEPQQLDMCGGDEERYDREQRPALMVQAIEELQDGGVEADIWKIEGIDDRERCAEIAATVRRGGRHQVSCIVLGRGASDTRVEEWLRAGSGIPGYIGFAIGRSIFGEAVKGFADGSMPVEQGADLVALKYRRFIGVYEDAAVGVA